MSVRLERPLPCVSNDGKKRRTPSNGKLHLVFLKKTVYFPFSELFISLNLIHLAPFGTQA